MRPFPSERLRRIAAPIAALMALGCPAPSPSEETRAAATPPPPPAPWYHRAAALDLTGDGRPDSARVEAFGARPDSLRIVLTLVVDGREKHREEWGSSYELALADSADRVRPRVDALLRAQLDSVLSSVRVQPLDAPAARPMREDSAVLAALVPRPTHRVSFAYGYETTVRLVWDAPRQRFVRLWSCC